MLQNWERRPFRGYYGDGRIAIVGLQAVSRGVEILGGDDIVRVGPLGEHLLTRPTLDHLPDNRGELPKPSANGDALDDRHDDQALD